MIKTILLLILGSISPPALQCQVVIGHVLDTNGRPVPFVHVFPADSARNPLAIGTLSDSAGGFTLRLKGLWPRYLDFRRLGFRAEAPRRLEWMASDTIRLDAVVRALPYVLPTVLVTAGDCTQIGSDQSPGDIEQLWSEAMSAIAARQAFEGEFSYQRHSTGHRVFNGASIAVDTTMNVRPPPPPLDLSKASAPLISYRQGNLFRKTRLNVSSVDIGLLLQPAFVSQYCVVSLAPTDSSGEVLLTMRERHPPNPSATVSWTMHFRPGFPGPVRITFDYFVRERLVGRAEHRYALFEIGGFRFPLASELSIALIDPRSGNTSSDARMQFSYADFVRVVREP
jgi:hypothetical protein